VLATPWSAAEAALKETGDLRGTVVVDATNPLKSDLSGLAIGHSTSAAEEVPFRERESSRPSIPSAPHTWPIRASGRSAPACSSAETTRSQDPDHRRAYG